MSDSNNSYDLLPPEYFITDDPLSNLSAIQNRVDSLSQILSNSVNANTPLSPHDSRTITTELNSAIQHIVINGAALIASSHGTHTHPNRRSDGDDFVIVELDVMELTAEHSHTCTICGKGFKRDANLRMHMRSHGDQFKTLQFLSKPNDLENYGPKTRFSCPYGGCSRNKQHKDFRPLKSVICAKNHFKRSHCPKKFSCCRCKNRCFSLLSDLKNHMKHCVVQLQDDHTNKWNDSNNRNNTSILNVVDEEDENRGFEFEEFRLNEDEQCSQRVNLWSSNDEWIHF